MNVQKMSSKWSSTSSYLSVLTLFEHPMDVQDMSSKWSSTSSYLTGPKPVWTPHGRPKYVLKMIVYLFLFDWHNICLNTPWTPKDVLKGILYKFQFGCSKPIRTPHGRANDVLKLIVCQSYLSVPTIFEHPMDVQKMSSKWSSTSSYLTDTKPVWTPHGRPNDVLKGILYKSLFECPNHIWTPYERPKDVLKVIVYLFLFDWHNICLNIPWTSKWCPQFDRHPFPIWLTQHLFEYHMDVQKMSSKWLSTSSYLTDTKPVWTPHGRPENAPKWSPTSSYLAEPTLFELPMGVQMMSSNWSSTSPIWLTQNLFEHPMDVPLEEKSLFCFKYILTVVFWRNRFQIVRTHVVVVIWFANDNRLRYIWSIFFLRR